MVEYPGLWRCAQYGQSDVIWHDSAGAGLEERNGAMSQGIQMASRDRKGQQNRIF